MGIKDYSYSCIIYHIQLQTIRIIYVKFLLSQKEITDYSYFDIIFVNVNSINSIFTFYSLDLMI